MIPAGTLVRIRDPRWPARTMRTIIAVLDGDGSLHAYHVQELELTRTERGSAYHRTYECVPPSLIEPLEGHR